MHQVWTEKFVVRSSELDASGRASAEAVCSWLQEAAGNHATRLGWAVDDLLPKGLTWVLTRLRVDLDRLPSWRQEVEVATWPSGVDRAWALRDFRMTDGGGAAIGVAVTAWAILDLASRRPISPPDDLQEIARGTPPRVLDGPFGRVPELSEPEAATPIVVRFADLDLNRHANNVRMVGWVLEGLPDAVRFGTLRRLEVEFRAEALLGEALRSETAAAAEKTFLHRVVRIDDGREIVRARTTWR